MNYRKVRDMKQEVEWKTNIQLIKQLMDLKKKRVYIL